MLLNMNYQAGFDERSEALMELSAFSSLEEMLALISIHGDKIGELTSAKMGINPTMTTRRKRGVFLLQQPFI